LYFGKKFAITDARDLDGLDVSRSFVTFGERGEHLGIVDDGKGRCERADEILFAERIDAVFDAHAGIRLAERRCRNADVPDAAMRGGGGEAGHVEQRTATNGNDVAMAIKVIAINVRMNFRDVEVGIFRPFAAFDDERRANELEAVRRMGKP